MDPSGVFSHPMLLSPDRWTCADAAGPLASVRVAPWYRTWYASHADMHARAEICLALDGNIPYGVGDGFVRMTPGTALCLPSGIRHQGGYPGGLSRARHLWFMGLEGAVSVQRIETTERGHAVMADCSLVLTEAEVGASIQYPADADAAVRALRLRGLLCLLVAAFVDKARRPAPAARGVFRREIISAIEAHIVATSGGDASLGRLARIAGYSPWHFHRLFRETTGMTLHAYVDQCRRVSARRYREDGLPVKEIARRLGFSCAAAYCRWARSRESDR